MYGSMQWACCCKLGIAARRQLTLQCAGAAVLYATESRCRRGAGGKPGGGTARAGGLPCDTSHRSSNEKKDKTHLARIAPRCIDRCSLRRAARCRPCVASRSHPLAPCSVSEFAATTLLVVWRPQAHRPRLARPAPRTAACSTQGATHRGRPPWPAPRRRPRRPRPPASAAATPPTSSSTPHCGSTTATRTAARRSRPRA